MHEYFADIIAHCDAWLEAYKNGHAVPPNPRQHSASWCQHRTDLDDALARLAEAGVTYDPSCGPQDTRSVPILHALSEANEARFHWLALQPEQRDEALFARYEVDGQKMHYTKHLLALREAEDQHQQEVRRAVALKMQKPCANEQEGPLKGDTRPGAPKSLRGVVRALVWLNRRLYAVLRNEEQQKAAWRRGMWRKVGHTVIWLQKLHSQAGLHIPIRAEIDT